MACRLGDGGDGCGNGERGVLGGKRLWNGERLGMRADAEADRCFSGGVGARVACFMAVLSVINGRWGRGDWAGVRSGATSSVAGSSSDDRSCAIALGTWLGMLGARLRGGA